MADEVKPTGGRASFIICRPTQAVDDSGVDMDLKKGGLVPVKENDAPDAYYFSIINTGAEKVYAVFDDLAANIDTTDTGNLLNTFDFVLDEKDGDRDNIELSLKANQISFRCASGKTSTVNFLAK